tara:strand:- start:60 stop:755 length:696 start_codon:yes stop_codon:yes gene_type:complete
MKFSIVIPVFNEGNNLSLLITKINFFLKKYKYEIIIVDDSSTDDSKNILKKLKKKFKNLKAIFRNKKRDLSKSCSEGFEISKYDYILVMDGDLQHNPKYIPFMISKFEKNKCDFVIGARNLIKKRVKSLSFFRQSSSIIMIKFFDFIFGKKTIDPMSGFFLFKKNIYIRNKKNLFLKGFKILADLIYSEKKFIIKDIVIKFDYRKKGDSKLNFKILLILLNFIIYRFLKNI